MVDIYYIEYITMKSFSDYESISGVNPLYFIVGEVGGFMEESNRNKYLFFASTKGHKEVTFN